MLNSVKFGRPLVCALFALELRQLHHLLCTASAVAAAGSASVQRLQKLQEALMLQGRPVRRLGPLRCPRLKFMFSPAGGGLNFIREVENEMHRN